MKYLVTGTVTISVSVTVEASSEEEAKQIATEADLQTLCHSCSSGPDEGPDEEWSTSGELDGAVTIVGVEKR